MRQYQVIGFGDILRHNKRGSEYRVVGFAHAWGEISDQQQTVLSCDPGYEFWIRAHKPTFGVLIARPVFQISTLVRSRTGMICVLYAPQYDQKNPVIYARPRVEFTTDRFTIVKGLAQ